MSSNIETRRCGQFPEREGHHAIHHARLVPRRDERTFRLLPIRHVITRGKIRRLDLGGDGPTLCNLGEQECSSNDVIDQLLNVPLGTWCGKSELLTTDPAKHPSGLGKGTIKSGHLCCNGHTYSPF